MISGRCAVRMLSTASKENAAKILIADLSKVKELVYTGPLNSLVRQVQLSLTTASIGSCVGAPLLLHYFTSDWAFGSQAFFTLSVAGASFLHSWLGHRLLGRYVAHVYRLVPDTESLTEPNADAGETESIEHDRIQLVTYDLLGRPRKRTLSPLMLEAGETKGTWMPIGSSHTRPYLLFHGHGKQTDYFRRLTSTIEHDQTN